MAALVLGAAGSALGGAILPGSVSVLGASIGGASIGGMLGAVAGAGIDAALFGPRYEGPRIEALHLQTSTEGAGIARVFGRMRVAGQVIWAARFQETVTTERRGGKGGGARVRDYSYTLSFAVALCEGEIAGLGRVWADGAPLGLGGVNYRLYHGGEDQAPDALITAIEGAENAPAFRGVAYIVFEDLDLTPFGARLPNLSFEVLRRPARNAGAGETGAPGLETLVRGVTLIPSSGEFVYGTEPVERLLGPGRAASETHHTARGVSDIEAALDDLQSQLPACDAVNLIVSWFGSDLRAGECLIRPGVETQFKGTRGGEWRVNGVQRHQAYVVSQQDGHPVYGGTPSDSAVLQAIQALKTRGFRVTLTPFILMDVPPGNGLPDPYGASEQAAFPWRGRITPHPAPGQPGSPDKSAAAAAQIGAFFGAALPAHFTASGASVAYSGPDEWSMRRLTLHYARLAQMAGGVDAFVIGTEMRGITWARSGAGTYPAVAHLQSLAADVKSILPGAEVGYAADWSEYSGHQPADGSGDVYYHLDPLWADPNSDFIGIDWYAPLADWRDGTEHADAALAHSIYDLDYLSANVEGGEGYDWYYASPADRDAQIRTQITDGHGSPWVFRYKDLRAWWSNPHHNRPGGTPSGSPTAWVPQSKPVRFMELGCPAADKGPNQPNVFYDPKSSESFLPYYSSGARDDLVQRRFLEALLGYWTPEAGRNPQSSLYGGPMLDMGNAFVWTWDSRPWPEFPARDDIWADGPNWRLGHWLTGRMGLAMLADTVAEICTDAGCADADVSALDGVISGYVLGGPCSARDALAPLAAAYRFDLIENAEGLRFLPRNKARTGAAVDADSAVWRDGAPRYALTRAQSGDLPREARVRFIDEARDYESASISARDRDAEHQRAVELELPLALDPGQAGALARAALHDARAGAETLEIELPPSRLALEPGDAAPVTLAGATRILRVTSASGGAARRMTLKAEAEAPPLVAGPEPGLRAIAAMPARPALFVLDLPLLPGETDRAGPLAAAFADPWPGAVSLWAGTNPGAMTERASAGRPAMPGELIEPLQPGPPGRWDEAARLRLRLHHGALFSIEAAEALAGGNLLAVESSDDEWEVLSARTAELIEPGVYELSGLLRGLAGSERAMAASANTGARVVVLNAALVPVPMSDHERGETLLFGAGPGAAQPGGHHFETVETVWAGIAHRPLSPVHLRAMRVDDGVRIGWVRRTRVGGDSWTAQTPLGEEIEAYEVEILSPENAVALTLSVTAPQAVLSPEQETAIFGGPAGSLGVRVYQLSPLYGRGAPAERTLYLPA